MLRRNRVGGLAGFPCSRVSQKGSLCFLLQRLGSSCVFNGKNEDFSFFKPGMYVVSAGCVGAVPQSHCDLPEERKF